MCDNMGIDNHCVSRWIKPCEAFAFRTNFSFYGFLHFISDYYNVKTQ